MTIPVLVLTVFSIGRTEGQLGPFDFSGIGLARIDLAGEEIAQRPAGWRDREIARRRFHVQWCDDNGLPPQACEHHLPETQAHARQAWCPDNGVAPEDCDARFARLDEAFQSEWREERHAQIANIVKPDLAGRDLRNAVARDAFIIGVDLRGALLEKANLAEAQLEEANLAEARLESAMLLQADLQGATLSSAQLRGADLERANLQGANLAEAQLQRANLLGANLRGASLYNAALQGANLNYAQLHGADLRKAVFPSLLELGRSNTATIIQLITKPLVKGLTQSQLALAIGDNNTILPLDAETGEQLHLWSCWNAGITDVLISNIVSEPYFWETPKKTMIRERMIDAGWICPPDKPPHKVGSATIKIINPPNDR